MSTWVEEFVGIDTRVVCHLAASGAGRSPLTFTVEKDGEADKGPFATFDDAMAVAAQVATRPKIQPPAF